MAENILTRLFKCRVEIPLFFLFWAFTVCDPIKTNLIIFRTCYIILGYTKSECALLGSHNPNNQTAKLENIVEPHAAVITMLNTLTEGMCSAVICLFAGPWSDKFGRRPILIIPLIGYMLLYLLNAIFASLEEISPWFSILCLLPVCLTGGSSSYITAVCCYITDITSDESRGMRMGFFEVALSAGIFLGTLSSSYIFEATGYPPVFLFGAACCFIAVVFTVYCLPESLDDQQNEGHAEHLFQVAHINDIVQIVFKKREAYTRYTIICCVLMMICSSIILNGNIAVTFLFLREKFHWSLQNYTLYAAFSSVVYMTGAMTGVYFLHKKLRIPETILILISMISALNSNLLMGLTSSDKLIYAVPLARILDGVFAPMVRSLVSKVVPNEELGKTFSFLTSSMFLVGIVGSPLYTLIYNSTININPSIFSFVTAGIYIMEIMMVLTLITVRTWTRNVYISLNGEGREF